MPSALLPTLALLLLAAAGHAQTRPAPLPAGARPAPAVPPANASAPPADALACGALSGRVADAAGHPLVGATVRLRHAGFAAEPGTTNAEGQYLLAVPAPLPRAAALEISAGGYAPVVLPLATCQLGEARLEPLPGTRFKADGRIKKTKASGKIH